MNFPYFKYGDATSSHRKGDLNVGVRFYSRSAQAASLLLHADWPNGRAIA